MVDKPDPRRINKVPIPRGGGLAIYLALLVLAVIFPHVFGRSIIQGISSLSVLGINKWQEHAIFRLNDLSHLQAGEGYGIHKFKLGAIDAFNQK